MTQIYFKGDLHLLWTKLEDWTGLLYICEVWNDVLKKQVVGSQTSLKIEGKKENMLLQIYTSITLIYKKLRYLLKL